MFSQTEFFFHISNGIWSLIMVLTAIGFARKPPNLEPLRHTQVIKTLGTFALIFGGGAVMFAASFIDGVSTYKLELRAWVTELLIVFLVPLVVLLFVLWQKPKNDHDLS